MNYVYLLRCADGSLYCGRVGQACVDELEIMDIVLGGK